MPSRRRFLTSAAATGIALSMQGASAAVAQQKRVIVDSQVHLWPANTPERPWLAGGKPQLPEPFTIERIVPLMDEAGVDRVVIVPPVSLEGERIDYAQEAVKRYPGRFAIMARVALKARNQLGLPAVPINFAKQAVHFLELAFSI